MQQPENLLVVLEHNDQVAGVLDKAARLCSASGKVHVIRVVHESLVDYGKLSSDDAQALKVFLLTAEQDELEELVSEHKSRFADLESATIWNRRTSQAVLNMVEDLNFDFVLKSTYSGGSHFPRHPDDWNIVREARCPVLFTGHGAWSEKPTISATIDALSEEHADINRRVLEAADCLTQTLGGELDVVSIYPPLAPWAGDVPLALDFEKLKADMRHEVEARARELTATCTVPVTSIRTGEGAPARGIKSLIKKSQSDVVVAGTAARKGVSAWVIGNTSEALLDQLDRDLLILHV